MPRISTVLVPRFKRLPCRSRLFSGSLCPRNGKFLNIEILECSVLMSALSIQPGALLQLLCSPCDSGGQFWRSRGSDGNKHLMRPFATASARSFRVSKLANCVWEVVASPLNFAGLSGTRRPTGERASKRMATRPGT